MYCADVISNYDSILKTNNLHCSCDLISSIVIPITLLNLVGTGLILFLGKYFIKYLANSSCHKNNSSYNNIIKDTPSQSNKSQNENNNHSSENENNNSEDNNSEDNNSEDNNPENNNLEDNDLEDNNSEDNNSENNNNSEDNNLENNNSEDNIKYHSDQDIINEVRSISNEKDSFDSMAGTLISVTRNIVSVVDNADHIPKDKKDELVSLLKGVPGFISKIVDMNDGELNNLLQQDFNFNNSFDHQDMKKESSYLMETLDSLRLNK